MYYPRKMDAFLKDWSTSSNRKPLILRGARQTGKSATVRELGKSFDLFLELNFERMKDRALVSSCESAEELLLALKARENIIRFPQRTLLFLDEIQESSSAIGWLRFLYEDHRDLAVVAAGSLMDVRLRDRGLSFPVGRVVFRTLRPFSFFEFLNADESNVLADSLASYTSEMSPIPEALHIQALEALQHYFVVGGMPESVCAWTRDHSYGPCREAQSDLLQAMAEDIQKYRGNGTANYLEAAFENMGHHFGARFRYENFAPGFKSQVMKSAITKMEGALLLNRVWPTSSLALPLKVRPKSAPKLLPLDIGLAQCLRGYGLGSTKKENSTNSLEGDLAEMFVGQQLLSAYGRARTLHFWVSESARGNAEVDFLLEGRGSPVPVEVKSGAAGRLRSLHQFMHRSQVKTGFRLTVANLSSEDLSVRIDGGQLDYTLQNVPIYLAELLPEILL